MGELRYRRLPGKLDRLHKVLAYLKSPSEDGQHLFPVKGFGPIQANIRVRGIPVDIYFDGDRTFHAVAWAVWRPHRAKAVCHPEDEFQFEMGLKLSVARALSRMFSSMENDVHNSLMRVSDLKMEVLDAVDCQASEWMDNEFMMRVRRAAERGLTPVSSSDDIEEDLHES